MIYPNPMEFNGYIVKADAFESGPGEWQGIFFARKENEGTVEEAYPAVFDSREEAEQHALSLAQKILN